MVFLMNPWHAWISSTIAHWYSHVTSAISTVIAVCFAPSISSLSCPVIRLQGIFALFNLFDTSHASSLRGPQYTPEKMQRFSVNQFKAFHYRTQTTFSVLIFSCIWVSCMVLNQEQVILLKKYLKNSIPVVLVHGMFYRCL